MVVLINKGSASGSEVLAGALQGRPNVLVLGERSFGKASVQAVFPLGDSFALRLTTAHYYTADGRNIDGKGLEPDVKMSSPEVMPREKLGFFKPEELERDPAIRKALSYLKSGAPLITSPFPTWF
jgi:carboxyl-terminal processing protease